MSQSEFTNEDFLEALVEAQSTQRRRGPGSFAEWQQDGLAKAGNGGYSPGFGLMGHMNTSSRAPTGPANRPSGNNAVGLKQFPQQFGVPSGSAYNQGRSQYATSRPNQPPPWIDDVDMASVWYSPMEPVWPFGPPYYNVPREWNFPVGYNLNYVPQRLELMGMLRGMRQSWGILSTIIETRKDQLLRVPWTIQVKGKPRATSKGVDEIRKFFRRPDGKLSYSQWSHKLLDDLFVLDAPTLYMDRDMGGRLRNAQVLDGGTIFPLIDDVGRRPDTDYEVSPEGIVYERRQPAFQQIIYGLPMLNLSEDELIYGMMRPRPELPMFGYSPVEQILTEATEAIRKTFYQVEFWRCYDDETEVLTKRGWLPFIHTSEEDEFATRNPTTKAFEWQHSTDSFRDFYVGDMIRITGQRVDQLVTPNHRVILSGLPRALGGHTWRKGEAVVLAGDLVGTSVRNCGIPTTSVWTGVPVKEMRFEDDGLDNAIWDDCFIAELRSEGKTLEEIGKIVGRSFRYVSENLLAQENGWIRTKVRSGGATSIVMDGDQFCAFMGMWLSEGYINKGKLIGIAQQRKSKGYEEFKELLTAIVGTEPYYDDHAWSFGSVHLAKYLLQFGHAAEKFVPDEIMNATPDQIRTFFHYYYLGDGGEQTKILYTASKRMADQFVELAQKIGRNASMAVDDRLGKSIIARGCKEYFTKNAVYGVRIYEFGDYTKGFDVRVVENFSGYVSCVTVPNGTLLVRRNNKVVWSGNSGTMPELIITAPETWTPRQIATFQGHFDALLSGQLTLKSKVRFVPGGMKPFDIKNASGESLWSQRDELLVRLACYAFSVSPTPFIHQTNRATANQAQESAAEEGLYPLMSYWKDDIMDTIIQEKFGYEDIEFVYLPRPEADQKKQSEIHQVRLHDGVMTLNEVRGEMGLEPIEDGDYHLVYTGNQVVRLDQIISGEVLMPGAPAPAEGGGKKPEPAGPSASAESPQRGTAAPRGSSTGKPTPVHKALTAKDIADAADEAKRNPSETKKKVGNYRKGHVSLRGLSITIENAKGSKRGEKDASGKGYEVTMPAAYGYIRGYIGADGMQIDCYLGKHPKSVVVWVVDQDKFTIDGEDKGFDEHKIMLAYKTLDRVIKDYLKSHFDGLGHERIAAITQMNYDELKRWLNKGDLTKPVSEQGVGYVVARRGVGGGITKADTISTGTNLLSYDQSAVKRKRKRKKKLSSGPKWLELSA